MILRGTRPVTKGRPRLTRKRYGGKRRAYTPHNTVQFEAKVREAWLEQHVGEEPFTTPVSVRLIIGSDWVEVDIQELDESYRPKYVQGDMDNYFKAVADGLNGVAYLDDKQIHHIEAWFSKETLDEVQQS